VDEVVAEFSGAQTSFAPTESMIQTAQKYKERGQLTIELMTASLRRGQFQNFVAMFSIYTGLPVDTTLEVLTNQRGQGMALACRAFEIPKADFVTFFLLTNPMRSTIRIVDLKDMGRAIDYFDRLKPATARELIQRG
jgi:hypothetical protein